MGANIKYKDSVFSALFSDPAILKDTIKCTREGVIDIIYYGVALI